MEMTKSIWIKPQAVSGQDVYGEYRQPFSWDGDTPVELLISADSNYALYINGSFVNSGQYPDHL